MSQYCKYYKQKKQVSYDSGTTWQDVVPYEYQVGELYQIDSADCQDGDIITRWTTVPGNFVCEGKNKYELKILQTSKDNGATWSNGYPPTYERGNLIESNSIVCDNKWEGHYLSDNSGNTCPNGYTFIFGVGCVWHGYNDPIKYVRCKSSYAMLTRTDVLYGQYKLWYGYIGDCVITIGESAFEDCSSLTSITIPNSVTSIGRYAFADCSGLTNCTFAEDSQLTTISGGAFIGCSSLTSIDIPDSVTSIGQYAFSQCSGLTSIDIPSGVTVIDNGVFERCSGFTSIVIPSSVTSIGQYAFYYCSSLTSCTIGSGVTSIGNAAFDYCSSLTSVTFLATTPPTFGSAVFTHTPIDNGEGHIYVPSESVRAYKSRLYWYADIIQPIP